jgi:chromosome segregation ATPase
MPTECPICMSRLENNLGNLPCGHVMHFACLQTAFTSKRECPICRAAYPQHTIKIQKLFFDCSRAAAATDSSLDSSFVADAAEVEELNGRIQEKNRHIRFLEAAILSEKQANNDLVSRLEKMCQERDVARKELASTERRLRSLDQVYQQNRTESVQLQLQAKMLQDTEKRLRVQLSVFQYSKDEEKMALSNKDLPKEELTAMVTSLKRQNAELSLQVQKLEQDVIMSEERSGSVAQLLSSIDRGARLDAGVMWSRPSSAAALDGTQRKRARAQSAVSAYVQSLAPVERSHQAVTDDNAAGSFSALRLAKQCESFLTSLSISR